MSEAAICSAVRGLIATALSSVASQVHDGVRWCSQESEFLSLFRKAADEPVHAWMVTQRGADEDVVGTNNLTIINRNITIIGAYTVQDPKTGTSMTSEVAWRGFKGSVEAALRQNYRLSGSAMNSGPLATVSDAHRMIHGKLCHYVEMVLPVQERVSYAVV